MSDDVEVSAWVKIGETSRIDYHVYQDGRVEFCVGGPEGFVLDTDELGLQHLIVHVEQALRAVRDAITGNDEDCAME